MSAPIPGLVLASGASRRMGRPKALLPLGDSGRPFVRVICDTLTASGVAPLVVVTRAELLDELAGVLPGVALVVNPDPDRGQLSSLLAGLDALGTRDAALVTLVDLPLFQQSTVVSLLTAWHQTHAPLVRPLHQGRHGHPVIFGALLLDALRSADVDLGAKPVVYRFLADAVSVQVDDRGTVEDIDTPEAYDRLELH
ncbi:MAG: nucleotidyltransferase family protein [Vicinamibacteria bacterium]|nr:nucleotidyltransferase family protein [Vicinamibacteria bacterium]